MALLAKRVRAWVSLAAMASIRVTPRARAASNTWSKMAGASTRIRAPDFDFAEPRGAGAVARAHHLLGLAFATIGHPPEGPVLATGDGLAGIPKLGRDAAVAGIFQHADAPPVAD